MPPLDEGIWPTYLMLADEMGETPDYNELLAYTKQLEHKVAVLEQALHQFQSDGARVKTRFLANISHEIRTPMNAIIGFSHLLGEDEVDGDQREAYIGHITRNSNSLLNVMENLIDLTLIETGNLNLKEYEVDLFGLLRKIYDRYNLDRYRINRERVALLFNVRNTVKGVKVILDGDRLSRAFGCLIENSIRNTSKGVVEIGASFLDKNVMVFSVKDSSGLTLQNKARQVFEKSDKKEEGYDSSDTVVVNYMLAKGLVQAMNGEFMVDNSPFKGTTIEFAIPIRTMSPKYFSMEKSLRELLDGPKEESES
ncbi:MAG: HAMP domain-containing sensor histidine kinase [Bacteroidales bacterium]